MINLKDLWIGDEMKIKSSGVVGKFEGIHKNGKAIIRSNNQTYLADSNDLEIFESIEEENELVFDAIPESKDQDILDSIDLHIEILSPHMKGSLPERILDFQVKAFEAYLSAAKKSYKNEFTIIHGKGTGVLKNYVMSIVKNDKQIKYYSSVNDGGAVQIIL